MLSVLDKVEARGRIEGIALGRDEGIALGEARGEARGLARGLNEGRSDGIASTARRMLGMSFTSEQISQATGLSPDEVEALRGEIGRNG